MKIFVALCVVAFAAIVQAGLTAEQKEKMKAYYKDCVSSSGVKEELIQKARNGNFIKDDKLNQYLFCMFKKFNFIDENGELQIDTIKANLPAELSNVDSEKILESCKDKKGADKLQTVQQIYECFLKSSSNKLALFN